MLIGRRKGYSGSMLSKKAVEKSVVKRTGLGWNATPTNYTESGYEEPSLMFSRLSMKPGKEIRAMKAAVPMIRKDLSQKAIIVVSGPRVRSDYLEERRKRK